MQGIYTYIPKTNHVPWEYSVSAILSLLFMVPISPVIIIIIIITVIVIVLLLLLIYHHHNCLHYRLFLFARIGDVNVLLQHDSSW